MGEKAKAYWAAFKANVAAFWQTNKGIIVAVLTALAIFKFRDFLISLLVKSAKRLGQKAQEKDQVLAKEESDANTKAEELIVQAQKAKEETPQADENWYKK